MKFFLLLFANFSDILENLSQKRVQRLRKLRSLSKEIRNKYFQSEETLVF